MINDDNMINEQVYLSLPHVTNAPLQYKVNINTITIKSQRFV